MGESCSNLKTLDLEDKYDVKELKHTWPGLDDRIGGYFSVSVTGYLKRPEAVRALRRARRKRRTSLS